MDPITLKIALVQCYIKIHKDVDVNIAYPQTMQEILTLDTMYKKAASSGITMRNEPI